MQYTIHHIDGEHNHLADLGSRWGNRFARRRAEEHKRKQSCKCGLRGGPTPLLGCMTGGGSENKATDTAVPNRVLRLPHPKVSKEIAAPDDDITDTSVSMTIAACLFETALGLGIQNMIVVFGRVLG